MKRDTFWGTEEILSTKEDLYQVKILHAFLPLSLQVHPRVEEGGKAEVQIALEGIRTYNSYIRSSDLFQLKEVNDEVLATYTRIYELRPKTSQGLLEIEPGTVHGLVQGKVLEISQHSDVTYRLGRAFGRELHIERALDVIRRGAGTRNIPLFLSKFTYNLQRILSDEMNQFSEFLKVNYEGIYERISLKRARQIFKEARTQTEFIFIPTRERAKECT